MRRHKQPVVYHSILLQFSCPGSCSGSGSASGGQHFMRLVNEAAPLSNGNAACDDVRTEILQEEELRIPELVSRLQRACVTQWFRTNVTLCIPHGLKLRPKLPAALIPRIDSAMESYRLQLSAEREPLRNELIPESERIGWGAVGRAAEFLVSQRGLRS